VDDRRDAVECALESLVLGQVTPDELQLQFGFVRPAAEHPHPLTLAVQTVDDKPVGADYPVRNGGWASGAAIASEVHSSTPLDTHSIGHSDREP
jgi:hypothetical protein